MLTINYGQFSISVVQSLDESEWQHYESQPSILIKNLPPQYSLRTFQSEALEQIFYDEKE